MPGPTPPRPAGATAGWVTMGDVAARAGVSKITVSRVLRDPGRVKPETRRRVQAAIAELGYVPDDAAGALSSRRSRIVGALISTLAGSVFAATVDGLSGRLREAGYQLLLATTDYSAQAEAEILATMLGRRPDGLVMTSTEHTPAARRLLARAGIPVIELWDLPPQPLHCAVGFSNVDAGAAMTRFLYSRGRQRPVFVASQSGDDNRVGQRIAGYEMAVRRHGTHEPRVLRVDADDESTAGRGAIGLARALDRWHDCDAVFCSSDSVALGALSEARRRGLSVPRDIAVAGFGDFDFAGDHGLELTTVRVPGHEIGRTAAALILAHAADPAAAARTIDVGFEIVARGTA